MAGAARVAVEPWGKISVSKRRRAWAAWALCFVCPVFFGGCLATARLSERRQDYQAVLGAVGRSQSEYTTRSALLQGLLQRSSTPLAAPYPDLVARLRALAGDLDALKRGGQADLVFENDFDAFAQGQPPVLTKRSPAWPAYAALDGRFRGIAAGMHEGRKAFVGDREAFDALAAAHAVVHLDAAALGAELDAIDQDFKLGLRHMEGRVRAAQAAVDFQKGSGGSAELLSNERDTLETMQTHLFRSGELAQHALLLSSQLRTSGAANGLWAGPGLPDDGSAWAKLNAQRATFHRRRAEFKSLAQAFTALEVSVPSSVPVQ